ncbi:MAG: hypothetical protein ACOYKC_00720 [Anaerolineaceae bacterium]
MTKQDGSRSGVYEETQLFFLFGHGLLTIPRDKKRIESISELKTLNVDA